MAHDRRAMMPDITGDWDYAGEALNADGSTLYHWTAQVVITEAGGVIVVELAAERSQSVSRSRASVLRPLDDGGAALLYDYANDAVASESDHDFFGVCQYRFDAEGIHATGNYFNYNGRYTFGRMTLTRRALGPSPPPPPGASG